MSGSKGYCEEKEGGGDGGVALKERSFSEPEEGKRKEYLEMKDLALARLGEERGRLIIGGQEDWGPESR